MKKKTKFKIQGKYDEIKKIDLFWSNKQGWVDFESATAFDESEIPHINFPLGTIFVSWLNQSGYPAYRKEIELYR